MSPPPLLGLRPEFSGDFKSCIELFVQQPGVQMVELPALETRGWLLPLADGTKLHIDEEELDADNFACDCCRIVGG